MVEEKEEIKEEPKQPTLVEGALTAADKLKAENERMEKNIKDLQEIQAVNALGGKSDAGEQEEKPKEETAKEYAERVVTGGLNDKRT